MAEELHSRIIQHLKEAKREPSEPKALARELAKDEHEYGQFRDALRELMRAGRVIIGARGGVMLPTQQTGVDEFTGTYKQHRRKFGFVIPADPSQHEDLFIPEAHNGGAITGDVVRAKITERGKRDGKAITSGQIVEILERTNKRFVGSLQKVGADWCVLPDGNAFTEVIYTPDAAARHIKPGTKVVVELTRYPDEGVSAQGVITEVLGQAGEKDVDLKAVIVQYNLPAEFPDEVLREARAAVDAFDPKSLDGRIDLSDQVICTIDPDDAKDYDDAISLRELDDGRWELGVHIADVAHFVPAGSALDAEARERGNSCYFPGYVIPMLPEVLSNGVCSLQQGVPRLCKSVFITFNGDSKPVGTKFANTIITSALRLRYREAQAIIDRAPAIPHPEGDRTIDQYPAHVVELCDQMNTLARRIQKRRLAQGQIVLDLPETSFILDENGRITGTQPEDQSFTHTLIEMFMVEANEAAARVLDSVEVPFLRRTHPTPDTDNAERLKHFVQVAGYTIPKDLDRKAVQSLLASVRGRPESFAINLAVLRSLTRAEYSPEMIGHYALASEQYCHFTSPIRRYADLTVHRLLDQYIQSRDAGKRGKNKRVAMVDVPTYDDLKVLGKHISFTERRADDAERELRRTKVLELLQGRVGEEFAAVVTGIAEFGIFIQLETYLIDGLVRYHDLMDDWWDVDQRAGVVRAQRTGRKIGIGDLVRCRILNVDMARRELNLEITQLLGRRGASGEPQPARKGDARGPGGQRQGGGRSGDNRAGGGRSGGGRSGGGRSGGGRAGGAAAKKNDVTKKEAQRRAKQSVLSERRNKRKRR